MMLLENSLHPCGFPSGIVQLHLIVKNGVAPPFLTGGRPLGSDRAGRRDQSQFTSRNLAARQIAWRASPLFYSGRWTLSP
jgi:hypothetical protein